MAKPGKPKSAQRIAAPVSQALKTKTPAPAINGRGALTVRHSEYIADISGSVAFAATAFSINPGIAAVFPWLNRIAKNYESYRVKKLHFRFETEQSTASNGTVMMAIEYDSGDSAPTSKVALMSYAGAQRSPVWGCMEYDSMSVDRSKLGGEKYVRISSLSSNLDIKTYDIGTLYVATQGCADTSLIGELYVDYEIELVTPQLQGSNLFSQTIALASGTTAAPIGATAGTSTGDSILTWTTSSTATFAIAGEFLLEEDNTGGIVAAALTLTSDATGTAAVLSTCVNAGGTATMSAYRITANVGTVLTFARTATAAVAPKLRLASFAYANA